MNCVGCCVWLTGLPASGKSTIAASLVSELSRNCVLTFMLDGDIARRSFCSDLGFSKEDRDENIRRNGYVVNYLSSLNAIIVCAFVSPYREARKRMRDNAERFIEVFVDTPLAVCEQRDAHRKGLYEKARLGLIQEFTGISAPYEPPLCPDVHLKTDEMSVEQCVATILSCMHSAGYLAYV